MNENGENPSSIASSDFNYALLSISSDEDEGCGTNKSPGLVARLMGLDSLTQCCSNSHEKRVHSMAKPISSITHNKLFSPIKSHGYMKPKNAACIMGASAKIVAASPKLCMRNKMSSVPLRALDMQEKLEAAQHESKFNVKGKPTESERSSNLYKSAQTFKGSRDSESNSFRLGKGKSASLVTPSKTEVQCRDTLTLNGNRRYLKQKEIKSNQKNCDGQNSNVLRQNGVTIKGKSTSKVDTDKPAQTSSYESSTGARKTTNKCAVNTNIESKRCSSRVTDKQKEFSVSERKSSSQKKRRDQNGARESDNAVNTYESKSIKCNVTIDESIHNDAYSMTESRDVISFTFTSPLRKNMSESQSTTEQATETWTGIDVDSFGHIDKVYPEKSSLSPTRLHVIDVDTLSVMLSHINPPQCTLDMEECFVDFKSISEDGFNSMVCNTSREHDNSFHMNRLSDKSDSMDENCCSSNYNAMHSMNQQLQVFKISPEYKMNWSEQSSTRSARIMELEYVKDILSNAELMEEELMVGETNNITMLTLFDLLENQRTVVESYEEYSKLKRKAIFDCVCECLELRCRQVFVARCKAWPRCMVASKKSWLAEEVYKEMLEFRSMEEEVMVDKVVSKDMNTPLGRWLDFDIEAFENGLEFELDIVTYLIDELVSDLWFV